MSTQSEVTPYLCMLPTHIPTLLKVPHGVGQCKSKEYFSDYKEKRQKNSHFINLSLSFFCFDNNCLSLQIHP